MSETPRHEDGPQNIPEQSKPILESERNLSPEVLEKIMDKVIDLNDTDRTKHTFFHSLGYINHPYIAGVFSIEKILKQGILSQRIAQRAEIKRNRLGWAGIDVDDSRLIGTQNVYADYLPERNISNVDGVLIDLPDFDIDGYKREIEENNKKYKTNNTLGEILIKRRIKPKNIIGIVYPESILSENLEEFIRNTSGDYGKMKMCAQLLQSKQELEISLPEVEELLVKEYYEEMEEAINSGSSLTKEQEANFELVTNKNFSKVIDIILPAIKNDERFRGITTFGDYLKRVGETFERPIYTSDKGLFWPKQMSYEEVKQFVAEREKSKTEKE
jgi:hypothetical protein